MQNNVRLMKIGLLTVVLAVGVGSAPSASAYPPFLRKAMQFGAKDCTFCHLQLEGGEGWNERGKWLIAEKTRRHADAIDPEWLKDYKEAEKTGSEAAKQGDKAKDSEKEPAKEGDKKPPEKKKDPISR